MISTWKIPRDCNPEQVFKEFYSGNCERFIIEVLDKEWVEQCKDFVDRFIFDDPLPSALGLHLEPESVLYLREWIRKYLDQKITYGCFLQREDEPKLLVAVDILYVRQCRDEFPNLNQVDGNAFRNHLKFIRIVERRVLSSESAKPWYRKHLMSFGILIRPEYKNLGGKSIEYYMVELRESIARKLGIDFIGSIFIGREMQSIARNRGYRLVQEFNEENLLRECGLYLGAEVFPIKIMKRRFRNRPPSRELGEAFLDPDEVLPEPDGASLEPELASLETDVVQLEPDMAPLEPELASLEPKVASLEPDVILLEPETALLSPEDESSEPAAKKNKLSLVLPQNSL